MAEEKQLPPEMSYWTWPPILGFAEVPIHKGTAELINHFRLIEENLLREFDTLANGPGRDYVQQRWLALARNDIEDGFWKLLRALTHPERVKFPFQNPEGQGDGKS